MYKSIVLVIVTTLLCLYEAMYHSSQNIAAVRFYYECNSVNYVGD